MNLVEVSRPRLLDLFCAPTVPVKYFHAHNHLSALRDRLRITAKDAQVLLTRMFKPIRLGCDQNPDLPALQRTIRGQRHWRCEPSALLQAMRQEPQRQTNTDLAAGTPGADEALPRPTSREEPWSMAQEVAKRTSCDRGIIGWGVRRLRRDEYSLASCRLHRDKQREQIQASASLRLCQSTPERVQDSLRQPPLRTHSYGKDRRNGDRSITGRAYV